VSSQEGHSPVLTADSSIGAGGAAPLGERVAWCMEVLDALPAAIYATDAAGRVLYYNQAAAALAGRQPELGKDEWCVTWRLYQSDGTPLPHDACPMAIALREDRQVRGVEAIAERPDGTRVTFLPYPRTLHDGAGARIGTPSKVGYSSAAAADARLDANAAQSMISGYRTNNGLSAVIIDPELMRLAGEQARAMAARPPTLSNVIPTTLPFGAICFCKTPIASPATSNITPVL